MQFTHTSIIQQQNRNKKLLLHASRWIHVQTLFSIKEIQVQKTRYCIVCKLHFGKSQNIGMEIRLVVARDCRKEERIDLKRTKWNFL